MPFTTKHIQSALDNLSRLRPDRLNPSVKREFSLRETIFFMAPKLTEMKELGFSVKQLAAALAKQEIVINPPTLNRYLSEYQVGREKEPAAKTAKADPPESKAAPPDETAAAQVVMPGGFESGPSDQPETYTAIIEDSGRMF